MTKKNPRSRSRVPRDYTSRRIGRQRAPPGKIGCSSEYSKVLSGG